MTANLAFANYQWSPDYRDNLEGSGWWSANQQFAPSNAKVINGELHLYLRQADVQSGGQKYRKFSSAEVDLVATAGGQAFNPGFGTYLVSASHKGGFNELAKNKTVAFGAFTYQKVADPNAINTYHELDMVEASRFGSGPDGWQNSATNAQNTIQPWQYFTKPTHNNVNVNRLTLGNDPNVTFVMHWNGANTPVTFDEYYGTHTTISSLPSTPALTWTTSAAQNPLIPPNGQQTVHLNLWREPAENADIHGVNPKPPTTMDEVTIKAFQYQA